MFERLAGKLLSRLLSKYFVSDDANGTRTGTPDKKSTSSWTQMGVWSGYVSLEGLELRKEVVNDYLRSKGLPLELLHCTVGRVEITVPWAKLGLTSTTRLSSRDNMGEDAAVVIVIDGVHALVRTNYEFDDDALRIEAIAQRRQTLLDSELFGKTADSKSTFSSGLSGFLQNRITEGILKDVLDKLHIHIRDVHVRLEDVETDPSNPFACGITLESLHVQADDYNITVVPGPNEDRAEESAPGATTTTPPSDAVRKVAQLNHLAIYWNALDYGEGLPTELSILHDTMHSSAALSQALDRCIARRTNSLSSPLRTRPHQAAPNHSYLLLPLDATCNATLSTNSKNLERRPALVASLHVDGLSIQVRDFQCTQIADLVASINEHKSSKDYRKFRPLAPATENPRAWWMYAFRIIRMELRESNMRWSWSRFHQRYQLRRRYCELYERCKRNPIKAVTSRTSIHGSTSLAGSNGGIPSQDSIADLHMVEATAPDEGAGPSLDTSHASRERIPLSHDESLELAEMEDGIRGDLSVHDIVLFRALVNARLAGVTHENGIASNRQPSGLRGVMKSMVSGDIESEEEYERLLAYLDMASAPKELVASSDYSSLIAVSIRTHLDRGCITLFSPLPSTADLEQHRRIQQRFLEFSISTFQVGYSLLGNYESFRLHGSLHDFSGTEVRSNMTEHVIISRIRSVQSSTTVDAPLTPNGTPQRRNVEPLQSLPFIEIDFNSKPPQSPECDFGIYSSIQAVEVFLEPDGEWLRKFQRVLSSIPSSNKAAAFWEDMGMAQINSLASTRAGLLTKVEAALFKHKNIDIDIEVKCPILHLSDGRGCVLSFDLGQAHFTTERLAGVAMKSLNFSSLRGSALKINVPSNGSRAIASVDRPATPVNSGPGILGSEDSSKAESPRRLLETSTPQGRLDRLFLGGSTMSVDSKQYFGLSNRSIGENARFPVAELTDEDYQTRAIQSMHSSFYDTFNVRLSNATVFILGDDESKSTLLSSLDINMTIEKSVIPADHTLCRLKTQCAVNNVSLCLSESSIFYTLGVFERWTTEFATDKRSRSPSVSRRSERKMTIRSELKPIVESLERSSYETTSESSSILDENEFIDALDGGLMEENAGTWFDDNWIADTESVIASESRSIRGPQRRRRNRSVSDVSSISDKSPRAQRRVNGEYLSAENLARLEEQGTEDDSLGGSDDGSDADSFHSALSLGGQADIADALERDIERAEAEIARVKADLAALGSAGVVLKADQANRRRMVRKSLKLELDRSQAELRALRASHEEVRLELSIARNLHYDECLDVSTPASVQMPLDTHSASETDASRNHGSTIRAKALLRARRMRSASVGNGDGLKHSLTSGLNRELFRGSLVLSKVLVTIQDVKCSEGNSEENAALVCCFSHCAFALIRRANDSRLYCGVDNATVSIDRLESLGALPTNHYLALGGANSAISETLLPSLFPQQLSSATSEEKLLRVTLDSRYKKNGKDNGTVKLRIAVGDIELCPEFQPLSALVRCLKHFERKLGRMKQTMSNETNQSHRFVVHRLADVIMNGQTLSIAADKECKTRSEYIDVSLRFSSFRVKLVEAGRILAAFVMTETDVRLVRALTSTVYACRSQVDVKCNNIQVLEVSERERSKASELVGSRDPYTAIVQLRIRTQRVPFSQLGGWVVERNPLLSDWGHEHGRAAWNMHIGIRTNSVFVTASTIGIERCFNSCRTLLNTLKHTGPSPGTEELREDAEKVVILEAEGAVDANGHSWSRNSDDAIPIRWRVDILSRNNIVRFLPYALDDRRLLESMGCNILMPISLHACVEEARGTTGELEIQAGIIEMSLRRASDDWPLLEPMALTFRATLDTGSLRNESCSVHLSIPADFPWLDHPSDTIKPLRNEPKSLMAEAGNETGSTIASISVSRIRFNLSSQLSRLVKDIAETLGQRSDGSKKREAAVHVAPFREDSGKDLHLDVLVEGVEVKVLKEAGRSGKIAIADPLALLCIHGAKFALRENLNGIDISLTFRDVSLDDLSSLPGVRVLTRAFPEKPCTEEGDFVFIHFRAAPSNQLCPSLHLKLKWGRIQCLLLPSILQSLLTFQHEVRHTMDSGSSSKVQPHKSIKERHLPWGQPFRTQNIEFSIETEGFECILSSRDILGFIRDRVEGAISVVAFRWKSVLSGTVSLCDVEGKEVNEIMQAIRPLGQRFGESCKEEFVKDHLNGLLLSHTGEVEALQPGVHFRLRQVFSAQILLQVNNFQVLRTSVKRIPLSTAAAAGEAQVSPYRFVVHPPAAGEQRITNPLKCQLTYQLAGSSTISTQSVKPGDDSPFRLHAAQAMNVTAGFIDVLVYIRQSAGGMNDALRVTVKPMIDMLNLHDEPETLKVESHDDEVAGNFFHVVKNATSVFAFHADGIQVTCVPGGATRLTESPIVKCAVSNFRLGLAQTAVPKDVKFSLAGVERSSSSGHVSTIEKVAKASLERFGVIEPVVARFPVAHPTMGAWVSGELSARYHNRRLVAWEPFIEPWVLNARGGIDLVRALRFSSLPWIDESTWNIQNDLTGPVSFSSFITEGINEKAGEKIRDIGRLLRSPFVGDSPTKSIDDSSCTTSHSPVDLSYLMMTSLGSNAIQMALFPSIHASTLTHKKDERSPFQPPGNTPQSWLETFGYPTFVAHNDVSSASILLTIADTKPLNVNLTGALIENVLSFMEKGEKKQSIPIVPHLIRNETGMTIRFQESLDMEQIRKGEPTMRTTLLNGREIPLSLRRSLSQSCDPHRAYVSLELGSLEDTAGRINHEEYSIPKGARSTSFFYKAMGKIPVDTVGVHKYGLARNIERIASESCNDYQHTEWIIVRVSIRGGTKIVSIESPFLLKNNTNTDILCELRDYGGISLLWRSIIPKSSTRVQSINKNKVQMAASFVPVPVDLVFSVSEGLSILTANAIPHDSSWREDTEFGQSTQHLSVAIAVPPPYSQRSVGRGLIRVSETSLRMLDAINSEPFVNLNVCAIRIGSFSLDSNSVPNSVTSRSIIPEQRMLLFRSPIVIHNHLPFSISVQARVKDASTGLRHIGPSKLVGNAHRGNDVGNQEEALGVEWESLGSIECGDFVSWTGAIGSDKVEVRVRLTDKPAESSRQFPTWSSSVIIPSENDVQRYIRSSNSEFLMLAKLTLIDTAHSTLPLSVALDYGSNAGVSDSAPRHDIKWFARNLPAAPRVVGIYAPFWIVDGTGQDLEFMSNTVIAGQVSRRSLDEALSTESVHESIEMMNLGDRRFGCNEAHLGLAELLDDDKLSHLSARPSFEILMIGDDKSTRLTMRRRMTRKIGMGSSLDFVAPWCDPIALLSSDNASCEVSVPPGIHGGRFATEKNLEPLALRARIVAAPKKFGGKYGTRLIHVVSRYQFVNEMGREIEVIAEYGEGVPATIGIDGRPTPFHFDDSSPIRFRPKEFGWGWSGKFSLKKKRREITLRLLHKLKGQVIIADIEISNAKHSPGNVIVFRKASHAPFRLENHTMHPVQFGQTSVFSRNRESGRSWSSDSLDSTLLPYLNTDFAWDEPDERRRSVVLEMADFRHSGDYVNPTDQKVLGILELDKIAPGTEIRLSNTKFVGKIFADGPTRVLRITDASLPRLPSETTEVDKTNNIFKKPETASSPPSWIEIRLTHGLGISLIDWSPQELLYIRLDDITLERSVNCRNEKLMCTIGCVSVDNQLWVTPYPVLLKMGRPLRTLRGNAERRRRRRNNAITLSWRRALNAQGGLTLLENVDLSVEPISLCVDGHLSELIWRMARHLVGSGEVMNGEAHDDTSRDAQLRSALDLSDDRAFGILHGNATSPLAASGPRDRHDVDGGFLATAAIAAKMRVHRRSGSFGIIPSSRTVREKLLQAVDDVHASKRRKYYIERMKISTINTDISWSGPLPSAFFSLPDIMRPALTFEALPVLLRPFSSAHAYGTLEDLVQEVKSHYLNIWRVFDLVVGLAFRPTFLIRACIYTSRERCASLFDALSAICADTEDALTRTVDAAHGNLASGRVYRGMVTNSTKVAVSLVRGSARVTSFIGSSLRYGGSRSVAGTANGSVRARYPRLFARVDGKDLLVEYVEGESAGKAILSRVRMGRHLGEGYVFHTEGVDFRSTKMILKADMNSGPLICMVTSERVLLLNGDGDANFCTVVWETTFHNLVTLEMDECEDACYDLVKLWYLTDAVNGTGKWDDRLARYADAVVGDSHLGLNELLCKQVFVPRAIGNMLRQKIGAVHESLDDVHIGRPMASEGT